MDALETAKKTGYIVNGNRTDRNAFWQWCSSNDKLFVTVKMNPKTVVIEYDVYTCNPRRCSDLNDAGYGRLVTFLEANRSKFKELELGTWVVINLKSRELLKETLDLILELFEKKEYWDNWSKQESRTANISKGA